MLKKRIVTATLGLIAVIAVLLWGAEPWRWLVWLCTLLAMAEFSAMIGFRYRDLLTIWSGIVVTLIQWWPRWHTMIVLELMIAITLFWPVAFRNRVTIAQASALFIGMFYIGYGGQCLADLRDLPHGLTWVLFFLISIWMTDTTAYFGGRLFRGPKLWPSISPSKTISGAITGLLGAAIGGIIVVCVSLPGHDLMRVAAVAVAVSIAGQLGDLVESAYKRTAGVKDSGKLLPGHGGMLDRVDSLLFAAPFALYFITATFTAWS